MKLHRCLPFLLPVLLAAAAAQAEPLHLYLGAGASPATMSFSGLPSFNGTVSISQSVSGWNAIVGMRPLKHVGFEFDHIDMGHHQTATGSVSVDGSARAQGLFVVGYLPLPLPRLDVYGKLGVGRAEISATATTAGVFCNVIAPGCNIVSFTERRQSAAFGAGVQFRFPVVPVSLRADYEKFDTSGHAPDLMLLDVVFRF